MNVALCLHAQEGLRLTKSSLFLCEISRMEKKNQKSLFFPTDHISAFKLLCFKITVEERTGCLCYCVITHFILGFKGNF